MTMNIYFAGSIRGGLADRELYQKLIRFLQQYGKVLTEHVGDMERSLKREDVQTIQDIYTEDMRWLEESDLVVAEVSTPSLGVGYEIACAEKFGKPVLCLYHPGEGRSLSLMLRGNPHVTVREYQAFEELKGHVTEFLKARKNAHDPSLSTHSDRSRSG
ncbi:MAG: nucleoside 2-deoxyribosyltransferase [Patescibacteria group bacterium]